MRAVIIVSLVVLVVEHGSGSPIYRPRGKSGGSRGTSSSRSSGRWGSSSSSGRSRFSSRFQDPSAYQVPSKTLSRITEFNSDNHPRARIRIPMSLSPPVRVMYSAEESLSGPNHERHNDQPNATPRADSYLSRTMSWLGLANGTDQYVPYRRRYPEYFTTTTQAIPTPSFEEFEKTLADFLQPTTPGVSNDNGSTSAVTAVTHPTKMGDLCTRARWNRELQFAEVPNLFLTLIADDVVSGSSTEDKVRFTNKFFENLLGFYAAYKASWDTFKIPTDSGVVACSLQSPEMKEDFLQVGLTDESSGTTEEPIHTSVRSMISMYSNISHAPDNLSDVVVAAKACLPRSDRPAWKFQAVLPCLEFSLTPEQLTSVNSDSMFGNNEICREHLNHDLLQCTRYHRGVTCRLDHLVALNAFARNYYLCHAELEDTMVRKVRERMTFEREEYEDWMLSFATTPNSTSLTNDTRLNTSTSYSFTALIANVNPLNITTVTGEL